MSKANMFVGFERQVRMKYQSGATAASLTAVAISYHTTIRLFWCCVLLLAD